MDKFNVIEICSIPKIIMQTWKMSTLPKHWQASQTAIKKYLPEWKYVLMTDEDNLKFVEQHFPDFLNRFKSFEYPIQRADAIRYMWLYVNGGVYIDLDLEIIKPLDDLFYDKQYDLWAVKSSIVNNVYTNAFIACKPKLEVMLNCLDAMLNFEYTWQVGKHLKVVNSTGPNMFTRSILATEKINVKDIESDLIVACDICAPKPCCGEKSYCRLLGGTSWSGNDTEIMTMIYCNRKKLTISLVVFIVIIVMSILVYRRKRAF